MTLASESCSRALVGADCLPVLLELIDQTNRSQAALVVVAGIIRVLSNIARVREREKRDLPLFCVAFFHAQCSNDVDGLSYTTLRVAV